MGSGLGEDIAGREAKPASPSDHDPRSDPRVRHEVINPGLPSEDFEESLRIVQQASHQAPPTVILHSEHDGPCYPGGQDCRARALLDRMGGNAAGDSDAQNGVTLPVPIVWQRVLGVSTSSYGRHRPVLSRGREDSGRLGPQATTACTRPIVSQKNFPLPQSSSHPPAVLLNLG